MQIVFHAYIPNNYLNLKNFENLLLLYQNRGKIKYKKSDKIRILKFPEVKD